MPRRVVITCWGSYGDVYPYVGVAKALNARGHRALVAAPAYYRETVEQEAIDFAAVGPNVDPADRETIARVMHASKGPEVVIRDLVMPALRHTYDELRRAAAGADLIVSHPLTFAAPALAEVQRVPWASTLLAPLGFFPSPRRAWTRCDVSVCERCCSPVDTRRTNRPARSGTSGGAFEHDGPGQQIRHGRPAGQCP